MPTHALHNRLKFLILEVSKQLLLLEQALHTQEKPLLKASQQTIDYVHNLTIQLQNHCIQAFKTPQKIQKNSEKNPENARIPSPDAILTYQQLGFHLQSLAQTLELIAQELQTVKRLKSLKKRGVIESLDLIKIGLNLIDPALQNRDNKMATNICRLKLRVSYLTQKAEKKLQKQLHRKPKKTKLTHALKQIQLIDHIEQASHHLLRIGETLLSYNLGQPLRFEQVQTLSEMLDQLDQQSDLPSVRPMGETKSGCTISGIPFQSASTPQAIFKEGQRQKLEEEKAGIEAWHKKFPGLAPQLLSYHKQGNKAALLFEYLTGETLEYFIQHRKSKSLHQALETLFNLLPEIWQETQIDEPHPMQAMKQLRRRLKEVYRVHPEFKQQPFQVGELKQHSLETLIQKAEKLEKRLKCPPAVYIHGDFNVDNILFDPMEKKISFIDLHRSRYADFVQDLSTLIVSAYRLMNFDPKVRKLIGEVMQQTYQFGQNYADSIDDTTYPLRMALGLARNYLTSTRFVLDESLAKSMLHRGQFLLNQIIQLNKSQRQTYRIPTELLTG